MDVLFVHGPPAAGKFTIGSLLSPMLDMPLFHNHLVVDVVSTLFEFGSPGFVELRERMWLAAFESAAREQRSFIFTFNPEATVDPELISKMEAVVGRYGGRVLFVQLLCSDQAVLDRLDDPERARFGKLRDRGVYEASAAAGGFEFPPLPEPFVRVDTEAQAPIESARLIATAYTEL